MTEDKNKIPEDLKKEEAVHEENPTETLEEEANEAESSEQPTEEKVENTIDMKELFRKKKEMLESIKKLENENSALKDRLARISAEYDNYRKRTQKEKEGIYADSIVDVVKELLPVLDNLEMSLKVEAQDVEALKKGVSMTLTQFQDSLLKLKVTEISTETPFDPNLHEAVMHVEDPSYSEKEIVDVFLKGYQREEKIIRYSVVKVAN
ncbi:MAG TPA: nucleotide exchange factor GrpE [Proteiniclasticum sp.]|jgi:molecular chaperone GrpE|uniref:nucleotide exchange factor GrpE n=1 Tax=Proteiniclasticum sp. TaxID=2053595 RepID=UPI000E80C0C5|nr:nucleotide exchange factor GrpE [Proteiniclasticum sp.]HBW12827.1 nucleotide exchange factor GrpE [Proteiniclasticum sp.]